MNFSDLIFAVISFSKDAILFLALLATMCLALLFISGMPTGF